MKSETRRSAILLAVVMFGVALQIWGLLFEQHRRALSTLLIYAYCIEVIGAAALVVLVVVKMRRDRAPS